MIFEQHNCPFEYNPLNNSNLDIEENENTVNTKKHNIILNEELLPDYNITSQLSISPDKFISLKNK